MPQNKKASAKSPTLCQYSEVVTQYSDDGKETQFEDHPVPSSVFEKIDRWRDAENTMVLCLKPPSGHAMAVSHEVLDHLQNSSHSSQTQTLPLHCIWFFGGNRPYQGQPGASPKIKIASLVCSMIKQLVDILPPSCYANSAALSKSNFDELATETGREGTEAISIDRAIGIIRALVDAAPWPLFFVFAGCDAIVSRDGEFDSEVIQQLKDFFRFLVMPGDSGRIRKILWVGPGAPIPIPLADLMLGPGGFALVEYRGVM